MKVELVVKGIVIDNVQKKILLLKRSCEEDIGIGSWENAGGKVEPGESPEEALRREIREEAGLSVTVGKLAYASLVADMIILVYYCTPESHEVTLSSEHSDFRWVGAQECKQLIPGPIAEDFERNRVYELLDN